jgi:hypothetical protein
VLVEPLQLPLVVRRMLQGQTQRIRRMLNGGPDLERLPYGTSLPSSWTSRS